MVIEDDFRYSVESWPEAPLETKLSSWRREVELRLPAGDNPRTRELANAMRLEAGSDREFVDAALHPEAAPIARQ